MQTHMPSTICFPTSICQILQVKAALITILIKQCDSYLNGCREHLKYKIHLVPISLRTLCNLSQWQILARTFFSFLCNSLSITLAPDKPLGGEHLSGCIRRL